MSVELRVNDYQVECDWGVITCPRPYYLGDVIRVGHLMLASRPFVGRLWTDGPIPEMGGIASVSITDQARQFFHLDDHSGRRWTWELFEAHWDDGWLGHELYVGRWPD